MVYQQVLLGLDSPQIATNRWMCQPAILPAEFHREKGPDRVGFARNDVAQRTAKAKEMLSNG